MSQEIESSVFSSSQLVGRPTFPHRNVDSRSNKREPPVKQAMLKQLKQKDINCQQFFFLDRRFVWLFCLNHSNENCYLIYDKNNCSWRIFYHHINVSNSAVLSHCVFFILKVLPKWQHGAQCKLDYRPFSPVTISEMAFRIHKSFCRCYLICIGTTLYFAVVWRHTTNDTFITGKLENTQYHPKVYFVSITTSKDQYLCMPLVYQFFLLLEKPLIRVQAQKMHRHLL